MGITYSVSKNYIHQLEETEGFEPGPFRREVRRLANGLV
ncbi:unnamed protein product [Larinioides sclopetarius]|uniref:Uncharacterized protein n=1 Tax=Larinioides sclopetarius TaxID=280406 RepID=A0AAV1YW21_9ARAC